MPLFLDIVSALELIVKKFPWPVQITVEKEQFNHTFSSILNYFTVNACPAKKINL